MAQAQPLHERATPEVLDLLNWDKPNYQKIWDYQRSLVDQIASGERSEAVILCEHETVATLGRRSRGGNILNPNVSQFVIERGGDVTLHCPGQLVVYPLIQLRGRSFPGGLHEYLRAVEEAVIRVLSEEGLEAGRFGPTGVWIRRKSGELKKIASLGISVRRWVTYHGVALNIENDLELFKSIRPCDFESSIMTSTRLEGLSGSLRDWGHRIVAAFFDHISELRLKISH
jgi:lipoyl(octanoyl) transferase